MRRWLGWGGLAVVLIVTLVVGSRSSGGASPADRAARVEAEVRCPTCAGQSALVSDAPAAKAVRSFVAQEGAAGKSDGRIEQELKDRYGSDILLRPPASGIEGLVWVLPIVVLVLGAGGLALAFRRWHDQTIAVGPVSDADRLRVESERRSPSVPGSGS